MAILLTIKPGKPVHMQMASQLALQIRTCEIPPDSKLPTVRDLAKAHGLNRNTVQKVYASLRRMGLVVTRVGDGTYTRAATENAGPDVPQNVLTNLSSALSHFLDAGMSNQEIIDIVEKQLGQIVDARKKLQSQFIDSRHRFAEHPPYRYLNSLNRKT